jgi:hypothetical protein
LLPVEEVIDSLTTIPKGFKAAIENTDEGIRVASDLANVDWCFVSEESVDEFLDVANFTAEAYREIDDADMLAAIQRTVFSVEKDGMRHALSEESHVFFVRVRIRNLLRRSVRGSCRRSWRGSDIVWQRHYRTLDRVQVF